MNLESYLKRQADLVDKNLKRLLPKGSSRLNRAMRYSLLAGGKRFRPVLVLAAAEMLGARGKEVLGTACAAEMLHTFTLIHDDLPAMDDSDLRRGMPSCHKAFGEDIAILAGDALNELAFKVIAENCKATKAAQVTAELSSALLNVVEGQVLDLEAEGRKVGLSRLKKIHLLKTASFIKTCARVGGVLANAKESQIKALGLYGSHLGLAFQIADDILDVVSSSQALGKPAQADKCLSKATYPSILGLRKAEALARKHHLAAISALKVFGKKAEALTGLADFVIRRKR